MQKIRVIEIDQKAYYTSDLIENIRFTFDTRDVKTQELDKVTLLDAVFKELLSVKDIKHAQQIATLT